MLRIKLYFSLLLFTTAGLMAQRTAQFNGKTYLIYPAKLPTYESESPLSSISDIYQIKNLRIKFPTAIDSLKDGHYLLYFKEKIYYGKTLSGHRNYKKFRVDSTKVYGTFEIKRGKKNGAAYLYNSENQKKIVAKLQYKGDALDGLNTIYFDRYGDQYQIDVHFQDGIANGLLTKKVVIGKGDTITLASYEMKDGLANGLARETEHFLSERTFRAYPKLNIYETSYGNFINGKRDGIWNTTYSTTDYKYYYLNGYMTRIDKFDNNSHRLLNSICIGKDSVLKYIKAYSIDTLMPFIKVKDRAIKLFNFEYYSHVIVLNYDKDNTTSLDFFKIGDVISKGYYNYAFMDVKHKKTIKYLTQDTVINNYVTRLTKVYNNKVIVSEELAVINEVNLHRNKFESKRVQKRYFKKGVLKSTIQYDAYFHYFPKDSLLPELINSEKGRKYADETYYQKALNFNFVNENYYMRKRLKFAIHYNVSGNKSNGHIIKYYRIFGKNDSMVISDTIMRNGKLLYQSDDILANCMGANESFRKLFDFANLSAKKHTFFKYGNSGFFGKLIIERGYSQFRKRIRITEPHDNNNVFKIAINDRYFINDYYNDYHQRKLMLQGGHLNGFLSTNYGDVSAEYWSNVLNGEVRRNNYSIRSELRYLDGLKDGLCAINLLKNYGGEVRCNYIYHKDLLDGLQIEDHHEYRIIFYRSKGILNGSAMQLAKSGYPLTSGTFKDGKANGIFTRYFGKDTMHYRQRCEFKHGFLCGEYTEFSDKNELMYRIKFRPQDSFFNSTIDDEYNLYSGSYHGEDPYEERINNRYLNDSFFYVDKWFKVLFNKIGYQDGDYTYYYKNGDVFKFGTKMENEPVGLWQFYREGGDRIYKRIVFKDSIMVSTSMDSIPVFGFTQAYYDDGKLMFKGLALDKKVKYSCESGSEMPVEDDYYLEFFDTIGQPMLKNGSGFISELQANGNKLKEGRIENYQKQGVWVYYSKFGLPEAIGMFKNGKRVGRWIKGDLGGLNLNETICFMNETDFRNWIETDGKNIYIEELYYVDGNLISNNGVRVIKE